MWVRQRLNAKTQRGGQNPIPVSYHDFIRIMIGESKRFPELMQVFFRSVTLPSIEAIGNYLKHCPELEIPDTEATAHVLLGALVFYMLTQEMMAGKTVLPMTQESLSASLLHLLSLSKGHAD